MPNYYAHKSMPTGRQIFQFNSRKERENWLTYNPNAQAVTAKWAEAAYKAKGVYTRPGFVDPKETAEPAKTMNIIEWANQHLPEDQKIGQK